MEKIGIKIVVAERQGMRRYLYPVRVKLPSLYRRLAGGLAVAEADGTLVPAVVESTPERRFVLLVRRLAGAARIPRADAGPGRSCHGSRA